MSLRVSNKFAVQWTIEGIDELLRKAHGSDQNCYGRPIRRLPAFITTVITPPVVIAPWKTATKVFSSDNPNWGGQNVCGQDKLGQLAAQENAVVLRCEVSPILWGPRAKEFHTDYGDAARGLLGLTRCSDIIFAIQPTLSSEASHIFAAKEVLVDRSSYFRNLFSSNFCESRLERFDPTTLSGKPSFALRGDGDDFRMFEELLTDEDGVKDMELASSSEPAQVMINDCSYSTYFALLSFLYTSCVTFLPPISDYLVAFQKDAKGSKATYWLEQRDEWLVEKALNKDPPPCNPHAMFRLADRYLLDELKEIAQGFILRSLTVENVAYELFCSLSLDYDGHRDKVLECLLENWDDVKKTRAWSHSMEVLEEGRLPGGAAVLLSIHEAVSLRT
ncbi:hypothetical protein JCM6882_003398 [Rhodosporidiobolus microsporus]